MNPNSTESTKLVSRVSRIFLNDFPLWQEKYDEMDNGYKYLAADHYVKKRKEWYASQRRPDEIFNIMFPLFNVVLGDFILNDQKTKVFPKHSGSPETAEKLINLNDHYDDLHDMRSIFFRTILAGIINTGYMTVDYTSDRNIEGDLGIKNIDEFEMMFDPRCKQMLGDDSLYEIRSNWLTAEDIIHHWSHQKAFLKKNLVTFKDHNWGELDSFMQSNMMHPEFTDETAGLYRVIEFHEREYGKLEIAYDMLTNTSEVFQLEGRKADIFLKTHPQVKLINRPGKLKKIHYIVPALNFLLESKDAPIQDERPDYVMYNAYPYGKRVMNNFGMFRNAKGPQDDFNDWRNTLHDSINKIVDPGYIYRPAYLDNPEDVENYGRKTGINFKVKEMAARLDDAIQQRKPPALPFAPDEMSKEAANFLMKITGVTPNLMGGSETKQENASLFAQRVNQAKVALATVYHSWQRTKKRLYEKRLAYMQKFISHEKYFMITTEKGNHKEVVVNERIGDQIVNDITVGKYGVAIETMDKNPNARTVRFMQKSEVVQTVLSMFGGAMINPQAIVSILDWWLRESDLGDIGDFISAFAQAVSQQTEAESDQAQFQQTTQNIGELLELAEKKKKLINPELPESGSGKK